MYLSTICNAATAIPRIGNRVIDIALQGNQLKFTFDDGSCVYGIYDRNELLKTIADDSELDQAITAALKQRAMNVMPIPALTSPQRRRMACV